MSQRRPPLLLSCQSGCLLPDHAARKFACRCVVRLSGQARTMPLLAHHCPACSIAAGEQVFLCYGRYTNLELLIHYGA